MSDTESFEYALWKAIDDCKIDESTDTITGSYTKSLSNQDRVVAAHIREIRDTAQQEYHRGFEAGRHSMDAEHRAIAMRLRALPLDGGSHENLSQIARAIWHNDFGWTQDACMGLRDELVRLMGGVNDGTCDSQCRGACAAGDSRDSGEHAEVSDDCVDCDILGPDARGHAVDCDFHELGVSDGGTADDCGADTCGWSGSGDLHMAGVTYDVMNSYEQRIEKLVEQRDEARAKLDAIRDALDG